MANNPAYNVFNQYIDQIGTVDDSNAKDVYDTAKRLGIGADDIDKALGAEGSGASAKYIAEQGWDELAAYKPPRPSQGFLSMGPATVSGGATSGYISQSLAPSRPSGSTGSGNRPVEEYTPTLQEVDATQTTEGLLNSLLSEDSVYIQRARDRAAISAKERGLQNTTMAAGAGEAAAIDAALPIAAQDAQIYQNQSLANQGYSNQSSMFNAEAYNTRTLQEMQNATAISVANIGASAAISSANIRANASITAAKIGAENNLQMIELNQQYKAQNMEVERMYQVQDMNYQTYSTYQTLNYEIAKGQANGVMMTESNPNYTHEEKTSIIKTLEVESDALRDTNYEILGMNVYDILNGNWR